MRMKMMMRMKVMKRMTIRINIKHSFRLYSKMSSRGLKCTFCKSSHNFIPDNTNTSFTCSSCNNILVFPLCDPRMAKCRDYVCIGKNNIPCSKCKIYNVLECGKDIFGRDHDCICLSCKDIYSLCNRIYVPDRYIKNDEEYEEYIKNKKPKEKNETNIITVKDYEEMKNSNIRIFKLK